MLQQFQNVKDHCILSILLDRYHGIKRLTAKFFRNMKNLMKISPRFGCVIKPALITSADISETLQSSISRAMGHVVVDAHTNYLTELKYIQLREIINFVSPLSQTQENSILHLLIMTVEAYSLY